MHPIALPVERYRFHRKSGHFVTEAYGKSAAVLNGVLPFALVSSLKVHLLKDRHPGLFDLN